MERFSHRYLNALKAVLDDFPHEPYQRLIDAILAAYQDQRRIFVMGNGGSAATASHWSCDINKGCCLELEKKFSDFTKSKDLFSIFLPADGDSDEVVKILEKHKTGDVKVIKHYKKLKDYFSSVLSK